MKLWISDIEHPETARTLMNRFPQVRLETLRFSEGDTLDAGDAAVDAFRTEYGALLQRGLSVHGPYVDLCPSSCDGLVRQTAWERYHTAWSIASSLGAESIVFHSDWKPAPYGFGFWVENVSGFWRDFLAAHQGLRIYVENVYDAGWEGLAALADRVPGLGLCFDAGHAHACSPLPMEEWIRGLGSRIGHVHLHNNSGVRDEHRGFFSVPEGGLDMEGLAELLETHLPGADLVLELPRPEELAASLEWAMNRLPPE